jgi:hypothetical protein
MTVPGGSRRDTFTAALMLWWAAAAIGEDSERTSELRMGRLPSAFDPLRSPSLTMIEWPLAPAADLDTPWLQSWH